MQADVAMAAGFGFFAKMFEQQYAAAGGGFADGKHGIEFLHFDLLLHLIAVAFWQSVRAATPNRSSRNTASSRQAARPVKRAPIPDRNVRHSRA